jgi:Na+:H+ antiporter, NhaB family
MSLAQAFYRNFLGHAPDWYKLTIVGFLLVNPVVMAVGGERGPLIAGWLLLLEFIFTLAMALRCYPLQPGGLLAIEGVLLGLTTPPSVYDETLAAMPVILLLVFMVAGIYFLRELLLFLFTKILLGIRSRLVLALTFCLTSAALSAFLDALTVVAVLITMGSGFYQVFHRFASGKHYDVEHDAGRDEEVQELHRSDLDAFRAFLRGLMMHAAIGTALGGVMTQVGEPQNLLIAKHAGWAFGEFFVRMAPVSLPVLVVGLATCVLVEKLRWFGYGTILPVNVRQVLAGYDREQSLKRTQREVAVLIVQGFAAVILILALGLHAAEVGMIGLLVIVLATALAGITEEQRIGKAFESALPFTALLVVFFAIVAVLHDQHLFEPIVTVVLQLEGRAQTAMFYLANAALSAISDNVFVATIYITEVKAALLEGTITREQFEALAIAINTGTNIPSVATPNGQAAFLFLLTSALAPLIRLSYGRMLWMALPYTVTMTLTGLWAVAYLI